MSGFTPDSTPVLPARKPCPAAHDLVFACSGRRSWLLLPPERIAVIRDEGTGRLEITSADGRVAHRPPTLRPIGPPWVRIAPGLFVHPGLVRQEGDEVVCPGGWRFPCRIPLPVPEPAPPEDIIPEIGARASEVLYLRTDPGAPVKHAPWVWVTDRGVLPVQDRWMTGRKAAPLHGGLVQIGTWHVNLRRVHSIEMRTQGRKYGPCLIMDDGATSLLVSSSRTHLLNALGIAAIDHFQDLAPDQVPMYRLGLRDFPYELAEASARVLRKEFGRDLRRLIANVVWQACRYHRLGRATLYGTDHRGFWYRPLRAILERAGFFTRPPRRLASQGHDDSALGEGPSEEVSEADSALGYREIERGDPTTLFYYFEVIVTDMIREYRLITYADLGFDDRRPDLRQVGAIHPGVILVVEKDTISDVAFEVAHRFGVTVIILGGGPELVVVEPFVRALKQAWRGSVRVIAFVDYDPDGYVIARAFSDQLRFYGLDAGDPAFLVTPDRFTPQEIEYLSVPLHGNSKERQALLTSWLAETGGIHGLPRGLHCDHLRPVDRAAQAFAQVTRLHLIRAPRRDRPQPPPTTNLE